MGAPKYYLQYDTTMYVRTQSKNLYTCKYTKTTNIFTEIYMFVDLILYVICHLLFNMQLYRYVIFKKIQ